MKPAETQRLYENECHSRRIKVVRGDPMAQAEFNLWHKHLKGFDSRDVEAALDAWNTSTERDDKGELRGKWLPKPGELIPLVLAAIDRRKREAEKPKDFVAFACPRPEGCGFTCCGFVDPSEHGKKCPRCGKPMHERLREVARTKGAA